MARQPAGRATPARPGREHRGRVRAALRQVRALLLTSPARGARKVAEKDGVLGVEVLVFLGVMAAQVVIAVVAGLIVVLVSRYLGWSR
jgi:hypothetical protein